MKLDVWDVPTGSEWKGEPEHLLLLVGLLFSGKVCLHVCTASSTRYSPRGGGDLFQLYRFSPPPLWNRLSVCSHMKRRWAEQETEAAALLQQRRTFRAKLKDIWPFQIANITFSVILLGCKMNQDKGNFYFWYYHSSCGRWGGPHLEVFLRVRRKSQIVIGRWGKTTTWIWGYGRRLEPLVVKKLSSGWKTYFSLDFNMKFKENNQVWLNTNLLISLQKLVLWKRIRTTYEEKNYSS